MKPLSTRTFIAGSAIFIAFAALNGAAAAGAESLGDQCRAATRAELKGPDCRMATPTAACAMPGQSDVPFFDGRVAECVKRGGPGRQPKVRS
jgi:hypothetical protein